ncbi:MAG: B12-binding domain-containing radical SAM protein [Desulfobulbaceae bacterium]|nr:B12-binding domain-containing radical SAM protein [Desulfobulbaceae bacterium]
MKVTLIQPCIGRRAGQKDYIGTWQMEPLTIAVLAGLTPADIELKLYDDRLEKIDYDDPTDLVAITVETYTAKRGYQIASRYREKGIPVVIGGFHATLCPEEVSQYAEAVIVGECETLWHQVLEDASVDGLQPYYYAVKRPGLRFQIPDRTLFQRKKYLPVTLLEAGRGCPLSCEFCAVCTAFRGSRTTRLHDGVIEELRRMGKKKLLFFVDDNFSANLAEAKQLLRKLIPLRIRWVSQMSLDAAYDEEFLDLLAKSGCQGVLIGFESLNDDNLMQMNKGVNLKEDGFDKALANLRRHSIRLYATFVFGYDGDTIDCFKATVAFAQEHRFYIAAFNHLTPFPGTPLYSRLENEGRLRYERWWLDGNYTYNDIPFQPRGMSPLQLQQGCIDARKSFFSIPGIWNRSLDRVNRNDFAMWLQFFGINWSIKKEISERNNFPLGDQGETQPLIRVRQDVLAFSPENFTK